jgi:hypothetical protein
MEKKFKLDDHRKQDPFKAPETYFDSLADKLTARIESRSAEQTAKEVQLKTNPYMLAARAYLAVAASIVGIIVLSWFGYSTFQTSAESADTLLAQVSTDDLAAYIFTDELEIEDVVSFAAGDIMDESPESIEDALHSLDDKAIDDLYNEFGISKDDTL